MPGRSILVEISARVIGMLENGATTNQAAMYKVNKQPYMFILC